MIKKEEGVLTTLSKGINSLTRDNTIGGMRFVEDVEERFAEKERLKKARMEHLKNSLGMSENLVPEEAFKENRKIEHLEKSLNMEKMSDPKKAFKRDVKTEDREKNNKSVQKTIDDRGDMER